MEECIVRVFDPATEHERKAAQQRAKLRRQLPDSPTNVSSLNITAGTKDTEFDFDEDASTVGVPQEFIEHPTPSRYTLANYDAGWKAKYRFPIRAISIKGTHKTGVLLQIEVGKEKQVRELIFDSLSDAEDFESTIRNEHENETERAKAKIAAVVGSSSFSPDEQLTFLVEIVSAWNIPAGDFFSSDPYVVCSVGGKEKHRTKHISKT